MNSRPILLLFISTLFIAGCASLPEGPNITALPGSGKSFDRFRQDDGDCREFAHTQVSGKTPDQVATEGAAKSAVTGAAIGAAAGAAIDGLHGAGIGAATGLVIGSLAGREAGLFAADKLQRRYDGAYVQCMYAKGHRVPVSAPLTDARQQNQHSAAPHNARPQVPPDYTPPPPPPGS